MRVIQGLFLAAFGVALAMAIMNHVERIPPADSVMSAKP
jgi:hypothetical protein